MEDASDNGNGYWVTTTDEGDGFIVMGWEWIDNNLNDTDMTTDTTDIITNTTNTIVNDGVIIDTSNWTEEPEENINNENNMNLETSGIIGLIISLLIVTLNFAPTIRAGWRNFLKYVNDEDFEHDIKLLFFKGDRYRYSQSEYLTFLSLHLFVSGLFVSIATCLSNFYPYQMVATLALAVLGALAYNIPRMVRFMVRGKKAISKIGKVAHTHSKSGEMEARAVKEPKY